MRTRYQHGSLYLDERKNGPAVWIYRWREYDLRGAIKTPRGTELERFEQYPTKAAALRRRIRIALRANVIIQRFRQSRSDPSLIGMKLRSCQNGILQTWHIGLT